MAEPEKENGLGIETMEVFEEEEENIDPSNKSQLPNTSLAELNMLLVFLSLFYFSREDCTEYEESEQMKMDHYVAITNKTSCISSKLETKRRERHEPKLGRRSCSRRSQTTIKDSR